MRWVLSDAAALFTKAERLPVLLRRLLFATARVISFTTEQNNRLRRFVRVVNDYKGGMPVNQIVEKYGCSKGTVLRYARLAGLPKRPKATFGPKVEAACITMLDLKAPYAEIAAKLGVSEAWISQVAKKTGHARYKPKPRKGS